FFGPKWDNEGNPGNVGELAFNVVDLDPVLKIKWDLQNMWWKTGSISTVTEDSSEGDKGKIILDGYQAYDWRNKLVIRTEGTEFFLEAKTGKRRKINFGILLHKILSRISYKSEAESAVHQLVSEGVIMNEEVEE